MANPTQKQQLDAAWDRFKLMVNYHLPYLTARLQVVKDKLK